MASEKVVGATTRVRELIDRQLSAARAAIAPPAAPETTLGLTFARGDRVVHLKTGQEGVVLRGERRAVLTAAPKPFDV